MNLTKLHNKSLVGALFLLANVLSLSVQAETQPVWNEAERAALRRLSITQMQPSPELKINKVAANEKAAALGHKLFFDTRLSINGKVSCATCHKPELYFTDGRKTARGVADVRRNTPTIVGINQSNWLFLDGRTDSLWSQAMVPIEDHNEHGTSRTHVAHVVYKDKQLRKAYEELFGKMPNLSNEHRYPGHAGPVSDRDLKRAWRGMTPQDQNRVTQVFVNLTKAIAAYELKLNPAPSRFDRYADAVLTNNAEQKNILNENEVAGLKLFLNKGNCVICHNGPMFSDFEFHNVATPQVDATNYDWGRFKGVNKLLKSEFNCYSKYNDDPQKNCDELKFIVRERDHTIGLFRTPMLRNVTKTAPYMHAGQYNTLKEVIKHYDEPPKTMLGKSDLVALPVELDDKEIADLEAFLHTLESEIGADKKWLKPPQ